MTKLPTITHRQFNNGLTWVVVALGLYITLLPWLPNIALWWDQLWNNGYVYHGQLSKGQESSNLSDPPKDNRLVIPGINLDEPIVEGSNLGVIGNGGTWRLPDTSNPTQGGNTVIVGHRWSYSEPATFYHLDKINVGERFAIWWQEKEYVYEVFQTKIVPPTDISVEGPSAEPIATLYTCTPIWTANNRLIIQARLLEPEEI